MFASLSIFGLYEHNPAIFKNLTVPAQIDKEDVIGEIIAECSDFALIYPDYDIMAMLIGIWSRNERLIWQRLADSEEIEYNPIENYDRIEESNRSVVNNSRGSANGRSTAVQADEQKNETSSTGVNNTQNTNYQVNGQTSYDSDQFKNTSRADVNGESSSQSMTGDSSNGSTVSTGATERSDTSENESAGNETFTSHIHGNIGVTQAADMLERYREVSQFCTVDYIVNSFKNRFCVQVY